MIVDEHVLVVRSYEEKRQRPLRSSLEYRSYETESKGTHVLLEPPRARRKFGSAQLARLCVSKAAAQHPTCPAL